MTNNKNGTLILIGVAALLLFTVAYFGNQILPEFHDVFNSFETDLPMSTSIVMSSYKGWWLLPVLAIILFIDVLRRKNDINNSYIKKIKRIGIAGILLAIFIGVFSAYAVYAPILQ